nr:DUF4402 domain-containing protein [uncultured Sphingomonas sp.]
MTKFARIAALAAATALFSAPAFAAPVGPTIPSGATNGNAKASVNVIKPLTLTSVDDMQFGDVTVLDSGAILMDKDGNITCSGGLTCATTGQPSKYNIRGTNNQLVTVTAPDVTLTNATTSTTLALRVDAPGSVRLTNAGAPGTDFTFGGRIPIPASTAEGLYEGYLDVTVEY